MLRKISLDNAKIVVLGGIQLGLVMSTFYLLKPLRDAQFLRAYPAEIKPLFHVLQLMLTAFVVICLGVVKRRLSPRQFIVQFYLAYAIGLGSSLLSFEAYPIVSAGLFYVLIGIFNIISVTLFWSQLGLLSLGQKFSWAYVVIGLGGGVGAWLGAIISRFIYYHYSYHWAILVSVLFLVFIVVIGDSFCTDRPQEFSNKGESNVFNHAQSQLIFGFIVAGAFIASVLDYRLARAVQALGEDTNFDYGVYYGEIYSLVNIFALFLQALSVPIIIFCSRRFNGVGILALVSFLLGITLLMDQNLLTVQWLYILYMSFYFSLFQMIREGMYLSSPECLNTGRKNLIDTLGVRTGDVIAALCFTGLYLYWPRYADFGIPIALLIGSLILVVLTGLTGGTGLFLNQIKVGSVGIFHDTVNPVKRFWNIWRSLCFIGLSIFVVFFATPTHAEIDAKISTWKDVIGALVENNRELHAINKRIESRKYSIRSYYGDFAPKISLVGQGGDFLIGPGQSFQEGHEAGLEIRWSLFSGYLTTFLIKEEKSYQNVERHELSIRQMKLRYEARILYFQYLINQRRKRLQSEILKRWKVNRDFIALKYQAGSEAQWSLRIIEAEMAKFNVQLENLSRRTEVLFKSLVSLLDQPKIEIHFDDGDLHDLLVSKRFFEQEIREHPEVLIEQSRAEQLEQQRNVISSEYYPEISVLYQKKRRVLDGVATDDSFVGLSAQWSLFDGLSTWNSARAIQLKKQSQVLVLGKKMATVRRLYYERWSEYKGLLALLGPSAKLVEASIYRNEVVSEQYRNGLRSFLEWERSHAHLIEAEQAHITAQERALEALAQLELAEGQGRVGMF